MKQVQNYFQAQPFAGAARSATAWIGRQVQAQASLWAYIDVFFSLALVGLMITFFALTLKPSKTVPKGTPA